MATQSFHHIVVGGGISGLSSAHYAANAGIETLVLEQSNRLGGCIQSCAFQSLEGYWVEAGTHSCFNSYGHLLEIIEQLGLLPRITAKTKQSYRLWQSGKRASILSALHPLELLLSLPRLFTTSKEHSSVSEFYERGLGKRNYRELFRPAFRSVICQDPDDYPASALFRKKPRRKDIPRNFTMPSGLGEIPAALATDANIKVHHDARATEVLPVGADFEVVLADKRRLRCKHLTLATPPDACAALLSRMLPEAAQLISSIPMVEIDTLVVAVERQHIHIPELAGLIGIDGDFLSAVSRDFLADDGYRGFAFHFARGSRSVEQRLTAACTALDVSRDNLAAYQHTASRLPALRKGHSTLIAHLDTIINEKQIAVTGNWFDGVSVEDCITRSAAEHSRLLAASPA